MSNFKGVNVVKSLINEIIHICKNAQCNDVIWLGNHPWIPIVREILYHYGIIISHVIDNNSSLWGEPIVFWSNGMDNPNSLKIESKDGLNGIKNNTICFLANTHYEEFCELVSLYGIDRKSVIDLYSYANSEINIKEEFDLQTRNLKRLDLKGMQRIEFKILKEFKSFCDEKQLKYFLAGGTLLGAVRHQGFIPWDDDVDVYMPYDDYKRFIEGYSDSDYYEVLDWSKNENYIFQFAKLVDKSTIMFHPDYPYSMIMGVYIDIFPLALYPNDDEEIRKTWELNNRLDNSWKYYYAARDFPDIQTEDIREMVSQIKYENVADSMNYIGTKQVIAQKPWAVPKKHFESVVEMQFEDELFAAPIGYDAYLKYRYGNYMELPPEEERVVHGFLSYRLEERK